MPMGRLGRLDPKTSGQRPQKRMSPFFFLQGGGGQGGNRVLNMRPLQVSTSKHLAWF